MLFGLRVVLAGCDADMAPQLVERVEALERAFDRVDEQAFREARAALREAVACVRSPLTASAIIAWHRAEALGAFWDHTPAASARSWAAVRILDPDYRLPSTWAPEGSPLRSAWEEAPLNAERVVLGRTPPGGWRVDGQPSRAVPLARSFVLQGFDAEGQVVHTGYHHSPATVPMLDFEALDPTLRARRRRRARAWSTALGGALWAGAAIGWWEAARARAAVFDPQTPPVEVLLAASRANQLSSLALGLGLGGAASVLVGWSVHW